MRDFAAKQNQSADGFLAATPNTGLAELVEALPTLRTEGSQERPSTGSGKPALEAINAEAGMAEMSEKFREKGGEIYLPAAE